MPKLYLVTGACGHLGNTIVKMLSQSGNRVRGLVLPNDQSDALRDAKVMIYFGDVRKPITLEAFFDISDTIYKPEDVIVIHTAGIVSISSTHEARIHEVNVEGTKNILDLCLLKKVGKLVYTSSVHAIPEQKNEKTIVETNFFDDRLVEGLYAKTKAKATMHVLEAAKKGLNATIVHPSGIIGPGDYGSGHLTQMVMDYLDGRLTASVKGAYDFVDVRDVAKGVLLASEIGKPGGCYILSGHRMEVKELFRMLHLISGRKDIKTILPMWFAKMTAPLSEVYYKILRQPPLYTRYSLYTLQSNSNFSNELAIKELGYHTRPIETTLRDTYDWLSEMKRIKTIKKKTVSLS